MLKVFLPLIFSFIWLIDRSWSQQCPNKCSCSPYTAGLVVTCGPGLTSFPAKIPATTQIFSIGAASSLQSNQINKIVSLSQSDFSSLPNVVTVKIAFCQVQSISPGTFSKLTKLVKLDLKGNKIHTLSRSMLAGLSRLEHLVLTDNVGCILDQDVFGDLTSLKTLELGGLKLDGIGTILATLTSLKNLDLHGNNLVRLEYSSFVNLNNLKFLDVSFNDLYGVQEGLRGVLSNLKSFRLDYNPWRCNCGISWLKSLPRKFITPSRGQGNGLVCDQPAPLTFKDVINVPDKDMPCIPARIISCDLYNVNIPEGQGYDVTCQVEGDPYPDVTWTRPDGTNISAILMTSTKNSVNFSIPSSIYTKHNGQWKITAENFKGSSIKTIDVDIKTTTTPTTTSTTTTTNPTPTTVKNLNPISTPSHNPTVSSNTKQSSGITTTNTLNLFTTPKSSSASLKPPTNSNQSSSSSDSSSTDTIYIIIIAASSLSSCVFLTGTCLFVIIVHKSKRKVRIAAKRRSVYSKQEDDFEMSPTPVPPTPLHEIIHFKE